MNITKRTPTILLTNSVIMWPCSYGVLPIQINPLKHKSDDCAGITSLFLSFLYVTSGKDYGTSAENLINICHCVVVLYNRNSKRARDSENRVSYGFQNILTVLAQFRPIYIQRQFHFSFNWKIVIVPVYTVTVINRNVLKNAYTPIYSSEEDQN